MPDERALVQRLQGGDETAFRELVDRFKKMVYYLALDLSGNHYDAEDISQEVFIKVHRSIGTFRTGAKLSTWLHRITVNAFIDTKRKKTIKVVSLNDDTNDDAPNLTDVVADEKAGTPEQKTTGAKIDADIARALNALSDKERSVFVMRHYHDLPLKEISASLDIAEGTVKSLLFRSIRKLRDELSFYRADLGMEDSV